MQVQKLFFTLLSAIFFKLPISQTPDNSNLFSISLEGSSYWESTVVVIILRKDFQNERSDQPVLTLEGEGALRY